MKRLFSALLLLALSCGGAPLAFAQTGSCSAPTRAGQVLQNTTIRVGVDSVLWVYVTRDSVNRRCSLSFLPPRVDTVIKIRVDTIRIPAPPAPAPPPPPAPTPPPAPAPVPPPAPAPPGAGNAHEPSGMTMLTDHAFTSKTSDGWYDRGDGGFSIVADSTDPRSPPFVGQALFDPMIACGTGPIGTSPPNFAKRTLYVSFWLKFDPGWVGSISNINKQLFIRIAGGSKVIVLAHGGNPAFNSTTHALIPPGNQAAIQAIIGVQGMGTVDTVSIDPATHKRYVERQISWMAYANMNTASATLTRGVWHHWEILLGANTPGQFNGTADWWLDGTQVGHYTAIGYSSATDTGSLNEFQGIYWNPTYGGGCNGAWDQNHWITNGVPSLTPGPDSVRNAHYGHPTVPQFPRPQWTRVAHLYASGKP